jgi:hypothetical protein
VLAFKPAPLRGGNQVAETQISRHLLRRWPRYCSNVWALPLVDTGPVHARAAGCRNPLRPTTGVMEGRDQVADVFGCGDAGAFGRWMAAWF